MIPKKNQADTSAAGRVRRGERSKHAIVEALLELVGEGVPEPTAEQVADRASVGIRSVFRHFSDMEGLYGAMEARLEAVFAPAVLAPVPTGQLATRIPAFVSRRAAFYESLAPYKRAANIKRAHSAFLQERHTALVRRLAKDIRRWFPELKDASAELTQVLELVTSFEAWVRLRVEQRLSRKRASAAVECSVATLLAAVHS